MNNELTYRTAAPTPALAAVVESYWLLRNPGPARPVWLLPDGRIDVLFSRARVEPCHVTLMGLGTEAEAAPLAADAHIIGVSLRLLAPEYLLRTPVADLLNGVRPLPADFWGFAPADLDDFDACCARLDALLPTLLAPALDPRKRRLSELLYAADGGLPVRELAAQVGWGSRQINRYFQHYLGLPLKAYSGILRFRAAFPQLKAGRLFPEQQFADQAHFIREVRRLAGVRPKDLARNENDRFIQFSAWPVP
ncbi:helix-turn-helix domain-containing protein [Hymenobacter sp. 15J16-1T3B]|uniref:helix-turn-helix domain-containing protein n=1 Tax=Hymenobacter sp. 15J16-1T3B TaxID=2886941 RepID=UPI001D10F452|nr:helix-turn-helix domain-containing protein [Hymenobacter sp. 15J16-1T3B]MCC3160491.1 helix-turn-helix domain-containing protein [Hymenobacter sp. 15J16-1T3B]